MKRLVLLGLTAAFATGCASTFEQPRDPGAADLATQMTFPPLASRAPTPTAPPASLDLDLLLPPQRQGVNTANLRFDINANEMPAQAFFLSLVEGTGHNMVVPPNLQGNISLSLRNVTIDEALSAVSDVYGYEVKRSSYGYRIMADSLQTRVFQVNYLNVQRDGRSRSQVNTGDMTQRGLGNKGGQGNNQEETSSINIETRSSSDFWGELQLGLGQILEAKPGRTITVSPQSGVIVATATHAELRKIQQFLSAMELNVSRQVTLEAKILEVTLSDGFQSGVNWAALGQLGSHGSFTATQTGGGSLVDGLSTPNTGNVGAVTPGGGLFPGLSGSSAFGGAFSLAVAVKDFAGFIELLETQGDVQVLSSPRVSTLNNQKAVIKVGTDEFFVTDISTTTINAGSAVTSTPSVALTPFFSGIALDVTPQVSADGVVTLHVHPTISDVSEQNKSIPLGEGNRDVPLATSNIRESDSIVRARSGQVIVIGGLMQTVVEDTRAGVPVLGRAPLIGGLFSHRKRTMRKRELVILLRPVVVGHDTYAGS